MLALSLPFVGLMVSRQCHPAIDVRLSFEANFAVKQNSPIAEGKANTFELHRRGASARVTARSVTGRVASGDTIAQARDSWRANERAMGEGG